MTAASGPAPWAEAAPNLAGRAPVFGGAMSLRVYNVAPNGDRYDLPYRPDPRTGRCPVEGCGCQDGPR